METTWTESAAILAEQNWQRLEQERHRRLLHQLKLEFQQERRQRQTTGVAPASTVTPTVIPTPVPATVVSTTSAAESSGEPSRKERVVRSPKQSVLSVQIR